MNKYFVKACFLLSLAFLISDSYAQKLTLFEDTAHTIPVVGAHVYYHDSETHKDKYAFSDAEGVVNLSEMHADKTYEITIYELGFSKIKDTVKGNVDKVYVLTKELSSINEVVVTAQFAPNSPEKAVHNIKIIDAKKIAAMGAVNLRDVMMNEPNVTVTQDNILGSGFSLQGIPGQNVKILINGVPVIGRVADNVDPSQINMNNVERIEVVQGPLSVSYGTDALAGTINIITKVSGGNALNLSAETYYESIGQYNLNASAGWGYKKHSFQFNGGRNYFDGWSQGDKQFKYDFNPVADSTRVQTWNPKEQYFATFNYTYRLKSLTFGYIFDYFNETIKNKGLPDTNTTTIFAKDDYYRTHRINNGISVSGKISPKFNLNGVAAYNYFRRNKNSYVKDLTDLQQNLSIDDGAQDTSIFTSAMSRLSLSNVNEHANLNYEVGYDLRYDYTTGARIENQKQHMGDYAVFSSVEWTPIKELTFRPGVRLAYNTKYDAPIVPSINMRYGIPLHNSANDKITLRASYAKGFRAPSLKELYFDFVDINHNIVGNPDLKAEQSDNFDFSANYIHSKGDWSTKTEVYAFYNNIKNRIDMAMTDSTGTSYAYFNLDFYKTLGAQLQQSFGYRHLKTTFGVSFIGRYNSLAAETQSATFLFAPELRCNVFYEWFSKGITFGFFYKYNGKIPAYQQQADGSITQVSNAAYNWADASISKSFFNRKLALTVGAKNLFNVTSINSGAVSGAHSTSDGSVSIGTGIGYFFKLGYHFSHN